MIYSITIVRSFFDKKEKGGKLDFWFVLVYCTLIVVLKGGDSAFGLSMLCHTKI